MKRSRPGHAVIEDLRSALNFSLGLSSSAPVLEGSDDKLIESCNRIAKSQWGSVDRTVVVIYKKHSDNSTGDDEHNSSSSPWFPITLSKGDGIPRMSRSLLYVPKSRESLESERHALKKQRKKMNKRLKKLGSAAVGHPSERYLLSPEEVDKLYATPTSTTKSPQEFVQTSCRGKSDVVGVTQVLAIDCEMCRTDSGMALTRVSVVNEDLESIYDSLVSPAEEIIDYCTEYSGITHEMLKTVSTTLEDVQAHLLTIVSAETILAGHSIENDLQALQIRHERILDTSELYPHPKGPPFKQSLRYLAKNYLDLDIQKRGTDVSGHCSIEDATATMKLVQLKVTRGPGFPSTVAKDEAIVERLGRMGKRCFLIDSVSECRTLCTGSASVVPFVSSSVAHRTLCTQLQDQRTAPHLSWVQFQGDGNVAEHVERYREILSAQSSSSMLIVLRLPDTEELEKLHRLRTVRSDQRSTLSWTNTHKERLERAALKAQGGQCAVHVFNVNS